MSNLYDSKYRNEKSDEERRPPKREYNPNGNDYNQKRRKMENQGGSYSQEVNYNQNNYKQNRNYDYDYDDRFQREGDGPWNSNYVSRDGNQRYDKNYGNNQNRRGGNQNYRGNWNRGDSQRNYDQRNRQDVYSPRSEKYNEKPQDENPYKSLTVDTEMKSKVQQEFLSPVSGESNSNNFENKEPEKPKDTTKEKILLEIDSIDTEIAKYEDEIELLEKDHQNYLLEQQLKREEVTKKRKKEIPNPIYEANLKAANESDSAFDHLLWKDHTPAPLQPSEYKCYMLNDQRNAENELEIESYIKESIEYENKRIKPLVKRYNKLKEDFSRQCMVYMRVQPTKSTTRHLNTLAEIPPMLSWEERNIVFLDDMHLVEDPLKEHEETRLIEQSWTPEDKKTFYKKFAQYPKDYEKILTFFPHKTYADIVKFYYNNKKSTELKTIIQQTKSGRKYKKFDDLGFQGSSTGRGTFNSSDYTRFNYAEPRYSFIDDSDSKPKRDEERLRWSDEEKKLYLELFTQHGRNFGEIAKGLSVKNEAQCKNFYNNYKRRLGLDQLLTNENSGYKKKPGRKSSITSTMNEEEMDSYDPNNPEKKKAKRQVSYWSKEEKDLFMTNYKIYGRDWKRIADFIPTKTQSQVKNFFQNYKVKLGLAPQPEPRGKKRNSEDYDDDALSGLNSLAEVAAEKKTSNVDLLANIAQEQDQRRKESQVNLSTQMMWNPSILMQLNHNMRLMQTLKPQQRIAPNPGILGDDAKKLMPEGWIYPGIVNVAKPLNPLPPTSINSTQIKKIDEEEKFESFEHDDDEDEEEDDEMIEDEEEDEDEEVLYDEDDLKSDETMEDHFKERKNEDSHQSKANPQINPKVEEKKEIEKVFNPAPSADSQSNSKMEEGESDDEQVLESSSPIRLQSQEKFEFNKK